ncbi:hypothetical protein [Bacteroides graminisolvens]|nr:hypothetical protein [Bacteroides graminisolvens]
MEDKTMSKTDLQGLKTQTEIKQEDEKNNKKKDRTIDIKTMNTTDPPT